LFINSTMRLKRATVIPLILNTSSKDICCRSLILIMPAAFICLENPYPCTNRNRMACQVFRLFFLSSVQSFHVTGFAFPAGSLRAYAFRSPALQAAATAGQLPLCTVPRNPAALRRAGIWAARRLSFARSCPTCFLSLFCERSHLFTELRQASFLQAFLRKLL
jgi:hypothetical protein